jgi:hypothetical protein
LDADQYRFERCTFKIKNVADDFLGYTADDAKLTTNKELFEASEFHVNFHGHML